MNTYLTVKWLHIITSMLLVGTGFGSAFYLYFINRTRNVQAIEAVSRLVVRADFWFTTPAVIIQPVTGIVLASIAGYSLTQTWLVWTYILYALAGACWLPVVWLQIRMTKMAAFALNNQEPLSAQYWQYARIWEWLGYPAFLSMLAVYMLMVFKPT